LSEEGKEDIKNNVLREDGKKDQKKEVANLG
jgi:hypothetical protein